MQLIPLQAVPNQQLVCVLNNQVTQLNIYQKFYGVFMDVLLNNQPLLYGVICENLQLVIYSQYLGYVGDFMWIDTQGASDPVYTGIGSRFMLAYLFPSDLGPDLF